MTVFLVGAGPGDPGLLTVRAAEVIARADVVVYDRLSVGGVLESVPQSAERVYVGKRPGDPRTRQGEINALLVDLGRRHETVVRLKGGDPFVFARGGEEAAALAAAGVTFEVVPGITSAIAVPAYAGIPVTLRHSSTSFTVVTGHEDPDTPDSVDWSAIARVGGTICILMGVARWPRIVDALVRGGMDPDTPSAAVHWGTRPDQRTIRATLGTLGDHDLASPSVIVVGAVAATDVAWFETRPLFGRRVVVTRTREQASALSARLAELGADPIEVPTIRIDDPADGGAALDAAVDAVRDGSYDWLVLTSPNGADRLLGAVRDARDLAGVQIACIGPGTAARLAAGNVVADLIPDRYIAEGLLDAMLSPPSADPPRAHTSQLRADPPRAHTSQLRADPPRAHTSQLRADPPRAHTSQLRADPPRAHTSQLRADPADPPRAHTSQLRADPPRALVVRAAVARDELPDGLRAAGWHVDVVEAYRTVPAELDEAAREAVASADAITFTSSSTVDNYVATTGGTATPPVVACIGPITAATAAGHGIDVTVTAEVHTIDGLVDALVAAIGTPGHGADRP